MMAVAASLADALTMLRAGGQTVDALAALRVGQSVDATVLAKLDTGEIRLALLGTFLDIVSPETLAVGEPLRLTVVDRTGQLSVALQRLDPSRAANALPVETAPAAPPPTTAAPLSPAPPAPPSPSPQPVAVPGGAIARPIPGAPLPAIAMPSSQVARNGATQAPVLASSKPPAAPWIDPAALAAARAAPKSAAVPQASASYRAASPPVSAPAEAGAAAPQAPAPVPSSGDVASAAPLATKPGTTVATPPAPLGTQAALAGSEPAPAEPSPQRLLSTPPPLAPVAAAQGATPPPALPVVAGEAMEPAPPSSVPPAPPPIVPAPGTEPPATAASRPPAANVPLRVPPASAAVPEVPPAPPLVRAEPIAIALPPVAPAPIEAMPASAIPVQAAPTSASKAPPVPTPANPAPPPASPVSENSAQTAPARAALPVPTPAMPQEPALPVLLPAVVAQPVTGEIDAGPQPLATTAPPAPVSILPAAVEALIDEPVTAKLTSARLAVPSPQAGETAEPAAVPARPALSPSARQALQAMVPQAVAGQGSRAPLLANAAAILAGPAAALLPRPVRQALAGLLAAALDPTELTAPALRHAVATSGTFQEASVLRLAGLLPQGAPPDDPREAAQPGQRLPALLLPPGEAALPDALAEGTQALRLDAKTLLLALASALQNPPADASPPLLAERPQPLMPRLDAVPAGQPAAAADLDPREPAAGIVQSLAGDTQAALDRVRLLQAASMPDNAKAPDGPQRFDRLVEIPLALPGGQMPIMSLAVGRDGKAAKVGEPPAWRMRLSLDLPPAGPMHALVSLRGGRAGVTLWAEKSETADQFRAALPELRDALTVVDLDITALDVFTGAPPGARPARAGKAVDRRS